MNVCTVRSDLLPHSKGPACNQFAHLMFWPWQIGYIIVYYQVIWRDRWGTYSLPPSVTPQPLHISAPFPGLSTYPRKNWQYCLWTQCKLNGGKWALAFWKYVLTIPSRWCLAVSLFPAPLTVSTTSTWMIFYIVDHRGMSCHAGDARFAICFPFTTTRTFDWKQTIFLEKKMCAEFFKLGISMVFLCANSVIP